jgi:hypothetical protein
MAASSQLGGQLRCLTTLRSRTTHDIFWAVWSYQFGRISRLTGSWQEEPTAPYAAMQHFPLPPPYN